MVKLTGDIKNRVMRLPKPASVADSLQPIFEAVSNSMHAIQDRFGESAHDHGNVTVKFAGTNNSNSYEVIITDNGVGLDPIRFKAFCTTDTAYKIKRGGKGVGRLLWLDAFEKIQVESTYDDNGIRKKISFDFGFFGDEQIINQTIDNVPNSSPIGTIVSLKSLRGNHYSATMPSRFAAAKKHFGSHFLADFLLGKAPPLKLIFEDKKASFPEAVNELLVDRKDTVTFKSKEYGELSIEGYVMKPEASVDLDGHHQMHLVSSGRTVQTRKIDGLIGVKRFGEDQKCVFHACVSGGYLDERVNQERTQFNFSEKVAEAITKECIKVAKNKMIEKEVQKYEEFRLRKLEDFVDDYPSFGFADPNTLLQKTPVNADNHEAFAKSLIPYKVRADNERRERVQSVLDRVTAEDELKPDLSNEIRIAAVEASEDQNRQLMEYVLRRKFIIDILEALLGKIRRLGDGYSTHLEDTFHKLFCPMRVTGDKPENIERSAHDLWLLDERLAPARYFASDAPLRDYTDSDGEIRTDLMVWDKIHGLGLGNSEKLERVLLVEFKKPERSSYKGDYVVGRQMNKYMDALIEGKIRAYDQQYVELSKDVIFHCYVVADLVGDLKSDTDDWHDSPNGRGKFKYLGGKYRGTLEVIEWKELVRDAQVRNQNFLEAASLSFKKRGEPLFGKRKKAAAQAAE